MMASAAASNAEVGESVRARAARYLANVGQLAKPCSQAMKNWASDNRHRAARLCVCLNSSQLRSSPSAVLAICRWIAGVIFRPCWRAIVFAQRTAQLWIASWLLDLQAR